MPPIDILVIPLLGGFYFVHKCNLTRYRIIRDNGNALVFKSSFVALIFYSLSFIVWRALQIDGYDLSIIKSFFGNEEIFPAICSFIFSILFTHTFNWVFKSEFIKRKIVNDDDDAIETTIQTAYDEEKYIQITLDSDKVYAGKVTDTFFRVNDEITSIKISPLASGYRSKETKKVTYTTYYGLVYEKIAEGELSEKMKISDFEIALRYSSIVSISMFSPYWYDVFQKNNLKENR